MSFPSAASSTSPLPLVTSDEVIARLQGLVASPGFEQKDMLLAFDADGTLWSGDVGIDNFEALLTRGGILPAALTTLRDEAASAGLPLADDPTAQARILYEVYARGAHPEENAFRVMACAFAGYREEAVRSFAADVARAAGLRARLHSELTPIVTWAARQRIP